MKTTIEVNGEIFEVDLDNLTEEEAKKFNINFKTQNKNEKNKTSGWVVTTHKIKSKFLRILFLLSLMAFFLCGFLVDGGWSFSWSFLLITPVISSFIDIFKKPAKQAFKTIMTLLVIAGIVLTGIFVDGAWKWCWVFIFLIPIFNITVE